MTKKISKADQSEKTRTDLLNAARELFIEQGYTNTTTEEIVQRTGVTRGAVYYHFPSKADLFKAVFAEVEASLQRAIFQSMSEAEDDVWQRMEAASRTFFTLAVKPDIQRILYVEGPAVLNTEAWGGVNSTGGIHVVRQNLEILMAHGYVEKLPLEALTCLWAGIYSAAALYIARAEDKGAAVAEAERCVKQLAHGLRLQAQIVRQERPGAPRVPWLPKWIRGWWKRRPTSVLNFLLPTSN